MNLRQKPLANGLPTREQLIEKSYSTKPVYALKRVFEAHGMVVTGPPLGVDATGK